MGFLLCGRFKKSRKRTPPPSPPSYDLVPPESPPVSRNELPEGIMAAVLLSGYIKFLTFTF